MKSRAGRPNSRQRILEAAEALAREVGPGNISLDAVAAKAGLSKGGLLYNFRSKAKLLEALVEMHVERSRSLLEAKRSERAGEPNAAALAYLEICRDELEKHPEPASGVLAAIAENPDFVAPVRDHHRAVVRSLRENARDGEMAIIAFLAIEGVHSLKLLESNCLEPAEIERAFARLKRELSGPSESGGDEPA